MPNRKIPIQPAQETHTTTPPRAPAPSSPLVALARRQRSCAAILAYVGARVYASNFENNRLKPDSPRQRHCSTPQPPVIALKSQPYTTMAKRKNAARSARSSGAETSQAAQLATQTDHDATQVPLLKPVDPKTAIDEDEADDVDEDDPPPGSAHRLAHQHGLHHVDSSQRKRRIHQSRRVVFILGALIGLLATVFFSTDSTEVFQRELEKLVNYDSVTGILYDWRDAIPTGIQMDDWKSVLPSGFLAMLTDYSKEDGPGTSDLFSVGKRLIQRENIGALHNVIMVPGVISTGIESWGLGGIGDGVDSDCPLEPYFRKRLWGSFFMLRTMVLDKACWLKHIMLDPHTGLDPPNIKLRAAQGFEAADFFLAGYWIWNKILQNLAVIGYGPNNMISAAYDWRLAYLDLEKRDGYFLKLKNQIEVMNKHTGEKSILVGHSMGSQVIFYFLKWVEAHGEFYGNGGSDWCNTHLEAVVDILGSSLGAPKAITALLLGEMRDTVQLNALAVYGLERFFSKRERVDMLRTFGGIPSMFPKGGEAIWGNLFLAPDDVDEQDETFGAFIRFKEEGKKDLTINESVDFLLDNSPSWFSNRVREQYSYGIAQTSEELEKNNHLHSKWANPLEAALPNAPDMKMYCFYGVGNPTERAYAYEDADGLSNLTVTINTDATKPVYFGDGDGTVSLLTHTICHEWQKGSESRFNPGNIPVTIVEIKHEPDRFDIRGGAKTAEHVDILGSAELNELVLRVAAGQGHTIENRYVSRLQEIAKKMAI